MPSDVVDELAALPPSPLGGWFRQGRSGQAASALLEDGWIYKSFDPVFVTELETLEDWARCGRFNRSWGLNLHTWSCLDPLLHEYVSTGETAWLRRATHIAVRWLRVHHDPEDTIDDMAWYDMALALRTPRLVALALHAARVPELQSDAALLVAGTARHLEELSRDRAFNPGSNHGFYTAASQVHAAKYVPVVPGAEAAGILGRERLKLMARNQFAEDGVHLEHSPDYHRMLLTSFQQAMDDSLLCDDELAARIRRAARVLGWMVQPNGSMLQFGDTPARQVLTRRASSADEQTLFILTDGAQGRPPTQEMAVFRDGGYAFVRSPRPAGPGNLARSGYLAFNAAFHSRAHKHADDLSVTWYERGQEILVDGGRYGYGERLPADSPLRAQGFFYAEPERQYVESTMAHNTLMMDGKDQDRRGRQPFGSGIRECTEADGVFDLSARVPHGDYSHRRRIIYRPGHDLLVRDSVYSQVADPREAILWFNLAGHFEVEDDPNELVFRSSIDGDHRLLVESTGELITPVRGQCAPLRGWRSRVDLELEPSWSVGFRFTVDRRATFDTRFRWV